MHRPLLAWFAVFSALPALVPAQDWTRFRGPDGQGIARGEELPRTFTAGNVRWRVRLDGAGHSSPVVWKDRVVLTSVDAEAKTRSVICLDAGSGERRWARVVPFEPHVQHKLNSFASSTPAIDDDGVYVVWTSGDDLIALAVDHEGEQKWSVVVGSHEAEHGSGSSPIVFDGKVILTNEHDEGEDNSLVALDAKTGEVVWSIPRRSNRATYATPVPVRPKQGGAYLLFASQAHGLTAVDPADGEILFEWDPGFSQRVVATPCVYGDQVFYSTGAGGGGRECAFVRLPAEADGKPTLTHRMKRAIPYVPCALALDDRFYMFTDGGIASCISATDGADVWRERLDGKFFGSPVSDGHTIWIVDRDGVLFSLAPGDEFEVLGTFELGAAAHATPAIAHGKLFVRTTEELICLGAAVAGGKSGGGPQDERVR